MSKAEKKTEVAVKEETAVAVAPQPVFTPQDLGIEANDIIIPKLLLMQNTSEYVGDKAAKMGDIVNSQSIEVLGGVDKPVSVVPLKQYKTWRVYDMSEQPPRFMRQDTVTASNANLPWEDLEEDENGKKFPIRRDLCMNFYVLLLSDIDKGEAFPFVASFKRTSIQAGRQMATHLYLKATLNQLPYSQALQLKVKEQKKEKNTFAVYEIAKGAVLTPEQQTVAGEWLARLASLAHKVDDAEDDVVAAHAAPTAAPVVVGGAPDMKF